jgi:hypothetical protein
VNATEAIKLGVAVVIAVILIAFTCTLIWQI